MNPEISIVIPAYNSADTIERCLTSLVPQAREHNAEIIVIDSSTDGTDTLVEQSFPTVTLVHFDQRLFPSQARAAGIEHARGAMIAFIDSDCTASPNWLSAKLNAHRSGHELVSGKIRCHPDCGTIGWAYYFTEFSYFLQYTAAGTVTYAGGGNLSFDRQLFHAARFREVHGRYALDEQLLRDLRPMGKTVYFEPSHTIFHFYHRPLHHFLKHEFLHGRDVALLEYNFGTVRYWRNLAYIAASLILPLLKFALILEYTASAHEKLIAKFIPTIPITFCGAAAWTLGSWWAHVTRFPLYLFALRKRKEKKRAVTEPFMLRNTEP